MSRTPTAPDEGFLRRWSRLKQETHGGAVPAGTVAAPKENAPLPTLDELAEQGLEADFTAFMHDKVEASLRGAALKQLFHLPAFNVMDGLDVYIDDYSIYEPIAAEMLPNLAHARAMLFPADTSAPDDAMDAGTAPQEATDREETA